MLDPHGIYEIDPGTEALVPHAGPGTGPVLLHALRGFVDAGAAGRVVTEHLLDQRPAHRLVTFDTDQLVDYRSRRPAITFDTSTWSGYETPELAVDLLHDDTGQAFLLMHGLEPDVQWERYVAATRDVVERFDVQLTVGVHGIPMGVPHTRPVSSTASASRSALVADRQHWVGTVRVPASAGALLELRLGQAGHDAMGFAVHVPHYLAQAVYPPAAVAALEQVERATGLVLGSATLLPAASEAMAEVGRQLGRVPELAEAVTLLERQYDSVASGPGLITSEPLPTADELGAQFEQFLASQVPDDPEDDA